MTTKDEQIDAAIEERATTWFVRHREGELTPQEQTQYMQWLRASPRHVEAYLGLIRLTANLPDAISGLDIDVEALARKIGQSRTGAEQALFGGARVSAQDSLMSRRRRRRAIVGAAAAVATATLVWWGAVHWLDTQSIVVPQSQQRMLTLEDGSTAHLNSNTRIAVRYSKTQRLIELPEGQALFEVTHDARRPFIVRTGQTDVVAVGTRFDVFRRAQQTKVTVVEGRVAVLAAAKRSKNEVLLTAGQQVQVADHDLLSDPVQVDAERATAWSRNEVSFAGARLADVAAQFNRNTGAHIVIEDPRLRDYRISGVFQAYDLDSFAAYLGQFPGIVVDRQGDEIQVRR